MTAVNCKIITSIMCTCIVVIKMTLLSCILSFMDTVSFPQNFLDL